MEGWVVVRCGAVVVLAWALGACVSPNAFEELSSECVQEEGSVRFDAQTRGEHCSGVIRTRLVHRLDADQVGEEGGTSVVDFQDPYIVWAEQERGSDVVTVRLLRTETGLTFDLVAQHEYAMNTGERLQVMASTGIVEDVPSPGFAVALSNQQKVRFFPLSLEDVGGFDEFEGEDSEGSMGEGGRSQGNGEGNGEGGSEGEAEVPSDGLGGPESSGMDFLTQEESDALRIGLAPDQAGCVDRLLQPDQFRLTGAATFASRRFTTRRFMMVSADCATNIYVAEPGRVDYPVLLKRLFFQAREMQVDRISDRIYVASGTDGLAVQSLSKLEDDLDEDMERYLSELDLQRGDALATPGNNGGNNDAGADPENNEPEADAEGSGIFTPSADELSGDFFIDDPVKVAAIHVTQVSFADDGRVFYLNAPTAGSSDEKDKLTYLVTGRLDANGVLKERSSIALTKLHDGEVADFQWQIVGLGDSLVAVLGNRLEGEEIVASTLVLYDVVSEEAPLPIRDLSTGGKIYGISREGNQLWVRQPTEITAFDVRVGGEHVR